jgi:hypothetical protein
MEQRICNKCKLPKDIERFPPNRKNGIVRKICLDCANKQQKYYNHTNPEKARESAVKTRKMWFERHKDLLDEIKILNPDMTYKNRLELARAIIRGESDNIGGFKNLKSISSANIKSRTPLTFRKYYDIVNNLVERIDPEWDLPFVDVQECLNDGLSVKECFDVITEKYFPNDKIVFTN